MSLYWAACADADPVLLWRCGDVDGDQVKRLIEAVLRDGANRILDIETGNRYLAEVVNG